MSDQMMSFGSDDRGREIVTLTIPRGDFGRFIQSLLGEPRIIEKTYHFPFLVDQNWITDLDATIIQRANQNTASLVDFQAKVFFETGVIKTLTSRDALLTFADNSSAIITGIQIHWTLLVQFPASKAPEKQTIKIQIFTNEKYLHRTFIDGSFSIDASSRYFNLREINRRMSVAVEHTELTWGEDVFNHVNNLLLKTAAVITPINKFATKINWWLDRGYVFAAYAALVFLILYSEGKRQYLQKATAIQDTVKGINSNPVSIDSIDKKINFYISALSDTFSDYIYLGAFKLVLFIAIFIFANIFAGKLAAITSPNSYVILNTATKSRYDTETSQISFTTIALIVAFSVNLIAGLSINYIVPQIIWVLNWLVGL